MRKSIAATTLAACVALGGVTGAYLGVPGVAGAAESATGAASWVQDSLKGLVDDGTITQDQADKVETALEAARPAMGRGGPRFGGGLGLSVVADALGLTVDELRDATTGGKTIAAVAKDKGVDVDTVVNKIVAAQKEKVDARVADGDLTQAQADGILEGAEERATALVNGDFPAFGHGGPSRGFRGNWPGGPDAPDAPDSPDGTVAPSSLTS